MLRHLRATNFAILSDVEIELGGGMNVLTGETGAGKSLIVEAVNLLRGGRASADIPRAGADEAVVEATVAVPDDLQARVAGVLEGAGLPPAEGEEVFIRRVIQRGGRSRCYVNGALTTAARLGELGALLIDLSGQHQHQGLVDPSRHLEILDLFAGDLNEPGSKPLTDSAASTKKSGGAGAPSSGDSEAARDLDADPAPKGKATGKAAKGTAREAPSSVSRSAGGVADHAAPNGDASGKSIKTKGRAAQVVAGSVDGAKRATTTADIVVEDLAKPTTPRDGDASRPSATGLTAVMHAAWAELKRCDEAVIALGGDERAREARIDYVRFQLDELDGAGLRSGEDVEIEIERARLASVDQLQSAARTAEELLYGGDDSARDRVAAAAREVERVVRTDPTLDGMARQLGEIETLIDDAADQLRGYADKLEGDPERLAWLDERLALIRRLTRKHGGTLDEVVAKAVELRDELSALTGRDAKLAEALAARVAAEAAAIAAAAALTKSRTKAARKLEKEVGAALVELGMGTAKLSIVVESRPLGPTGADRIELMLASNKGEDTRPLAKVASGGELSRIMLALKLALRRADEVATYVFDEVDTGIGGATAQVVGAQIRAVADHRQVLCVTHLPQIAAYADQHFHVEKTELGGRTETHVRRLTGTARKDELARMLGGHATSKAKAHAAELLAEAARTDSRKSTARARPS